MKNTFLKRAKNAGFSLVELIVVIAIMAILVGVAVPVYSSYIEKSQKAKDEQLVDEIIHALEIAAIGDSWYSSYPNGGTVGAVILTPENLRVSSDANGLIAKALGETFGDYNKLALSYDDWNIEYKDSSFSGKESALLGKVDNLTDILSDLIATSPELVGKNFAQYLNDLGVDLEANPDAAADAAVLYVAKQANGLSPEKEQAFLSYVNNFLTKAAGGASNTTAILELVEIFDGSYVSSAAAVYAITEGYCQYESSMGNTDLLEIFNKATNDINQSGDVKDGQTAVEAVFDAFAEVEKVVRADMEKYHAVEYFNTEKRAEADAKAYLNILKTVNGAQSEVVGSLGSDACFSSEAISNLFVEYSQGGVILIVEINQDGSLEIANPLK